MTTAVYTELGCGRTLGHQVFCEVGMLCETCTKVAALQEQINTTAVYTELAELGCGRTLGHNVFCEVGMLCETCTKVAALQDMLIEKDVVVVVEAKETFDHMGVHCTHCRGKDGFFTETTIHDNYIHCDACGHEVQRWVEEKFFEGQQV